MAGRGHDVIAMWIGIELTVYGMGLVFLLLALLWGLIALLVRLDRGEAPGQPAADSARVAAAAEAMASALPPASDILSDELMAAVVIACRAHRMARRKQAAPEMRTHEPGSLPSRWVGSGRTRQNRSWAPGGRYA
jgi:sodium pump decarboxylase gamma subunit